MYTYFYLLFSKQSSHLLRTKYSRLQRKECALQLLKYIKIYKDLKVLKNCRKIFISDHFKLFTNIFSTKNLFI